MGIFKSTLNAAARYGISNGYLPGQIGVWGVCRGGTELLRLGLTAIHSKSGELPALSYIFVPSHTDVFYRSLAIPHSILEMVRGKGAPEGAQFRFTFEFFGRESHTVTIDQRAFVCALHGKAPRPLAPVGGIVNTCCPDEPNTAALTLEILKQRSDEFKAAEAEKQRLEAEARDLAAAELEAKKKLEASKATESTAPAAKPTVTGDPKTPTLPACKTAIIFGSSTGNTKSAAQMLSSELGVVDYVKNVTEITPADFGVPEILILGIPTWHIGELQDDWAAMLPNLEQVNPNLSGKKIAIFGLGDQKGYPDTYVDAIQMLWEPFEKRGAKLFGLWPTKGYEFKQSKAVKGDKFMGLVLDIENQDHLSEGRVKAWAAQLKGELGL